MYWNWLYIRGMQQWSAVLGNSLRRKHSCFLEKSKDGWNYWGRLYLIWCRGVVTASDPPKGLLCFDPCNLERCTETELSTRLLYVSLSATVCLTIFVDTAGLSWVVSLFLMYMVTQLGEFVTFCPCKISGTVNHHIDFILCSTILPHDTKAFLQTVDVSPSFWFEWWWCVVNGVPWQQITWRISVSCPHKERSMPLTIGLRRCHARKILRDSLSNKPDLRCLCDKVVDYHMWNFYGTPWDNRDIMVHYDLALRFFCQSKTFSHMFGEIPYISAWHSI